MSHVLLMLCGHVQDKDLHMSHSTKSYIWKFFFFPYESPYPQGCISACTGDHDSCGMSVSYAKRAFSPGMTSCKTWTSSDGCVSFSYCQYNHISFTPTPNSLLFFFLLEWGFLVEPVALGWATYSMVWPHISIQEFPQMLSIHLAFRTAYRLMTGDTWSLQSIPEGNFNSTSFSSWIHCLKRLCLLYWGTESFYNPWNRISAAVWNLQCVTRRQLKLSVKPVGP